MAVAISARQSAARISIADIARGTTMSANYLAERLRHEKSFTLTDIETLGEFFGFDAAEFLGAIDADAPSARVTPMRRRTDVGAGSQNSDTDLPYAAGDDDSQADPEHETP